MTLHLIKLCVGCDTVDELLAWRRQQARPGEPWILRTRQTPRRAEALLQGGSLYRVYKGLILSRQIIEGLRTVGEAGATRCEIVLNESVIPTAPTPRRPFQGWRYLAAADAPPDLNPAGEGETLSADLAARLRALGAW